MESSQSPSSDFVRVSTILWPFTGLDKIDPYVVKNAARRGTKVHKICESIVTGMGDIGNDDEAKPYVRSFMSWWDQSPEVVAVEKRFYDLEEKITGQCDMIIKGADSEILVDLKTSSKPSKTWPVQGAAYAWLANKSGHNIKKIQFIHLLKTGKPAKIYEYPIDDSLFLSVLRTYNHFYRGKDERSRKS